MDETNKYLRFIAVAAVVLTVLIIAYTMNSASQGNRFFSGNKVPQPSAQENPHQSASAANNPVPEELFPASIAEMIRVDSLSGESAIESVSQLHGTNINVSTAYIASYQGLDNQSMSIWYSEAKNEKDAKALFQVMDEKMPNSQVFKNLQTIKINNMEFRSVTGMDLQHYYWQTGKRVIWIAIGAPDSSSVLKQVAPLY